MVGRRSAGGERMSQALTAQRPPARDRDVVALLCRGEVALVTLTGPAGVGKVRLALRAVEEARDHFAGEAIFVPLANEPRFTALKARPCGS